MDGADVVAGFEKVGGEAVTEGVAGDLFLDVGLAEGFFDFALEDGGVHEVAAFFAGAVIFPTGFLGEDPLPFPFGVGVGVFAREGVGELDAAIAIEKVLFMDFAGFFELSAEGFDEVLGEGD